MKRATPFVVLLAIALVAMASLPYLPTNLGGRATYVATRGTSMAPRFHAGDLAIVKPASSYRVGDVVAYHSDTLHGATVLHRIVGVDGSGHYTFKGDNNDFIDVDHPTADRLIGKLAVRIPHGGQIRSMFTNPLVVFPLVTIAVVGLGSGLLVSKRQRRRARRPAPSAANGAARNRTNDRVRVVVPVAAALGAGACLCAAIAAWNPPVSVHSSDARRYSQTIALGYSAAAPKGATYPDGVVRTGDPVFTRLVHQVDFDVALGFDAGGSAQIAGTYDVTADVRTSSGWDRHLVLASDRTFTGNRAVGTAVLDLGVLHRLQREFAAETGLDPTGTNVAVSSHVHVAGSAEGAPVALDNTTTMNFAYSDVAFLPAHGDTATPSDASGRASTTKTGAVAVPHTRPTALDIGPVAVPWTVARLLSILGIAAFLAGAALALRSHRRRVALGEPAAIDARYGRLLVHALDIPRAPSQALVTVDSISVLARIAAQHEQLILHAHRPGEEEYGVLTDSAVYRYSTRPVAVGHVQ